MDEINKKAYGLLDLLEVAVEKEQSHEQVEIIGMPMVLKLSNVKNFKRIQGDGHGNTVAVYSNLGDRMIGLSETNYKHLRNLASEIQQIDSINKLADSEFIEKEIFEWLILTYQQQRASEDLLNHIYNELENQVKEYVFYFKVLGCGIEKPFEIGRVEISHLSKEKLEKESIKFVKSGKTQEEFDGVFEKFKDVVLAIYKSKTVESKARKLAMHEIALAIDVIKCLLIEESISPHYQIPEVDFRINQSGFSEFLTETTSEEFDFTSSLLRERGVPVTLDAKKLEFLNGRGFKTMANFITNKRPTEAYRIGLQTISLLASVASTWDLHDRIVKIVSLFESVIIPEGSAKAKGHTLMKKNVIPSFDSDLKKKERYNELINRMYNTRDKYLHNGLELPIDLNELAEFQVLALRFVLKLLSLISDTKNLSEIQLKFKIQ